MPSHAKHVESGVLSKPLNPALNRFAKLLCPDDADNCYPITDHGIQQGLTRAAGRETRARDVQAPTEKGLWAAPVRQLGLSSCVVETQECCFGLNVIIAVEVSVTGGSGQSFERAQDTQLFKVSDLMPLQKRRLSLISLPFDFCNQCYNIC